MTEWHEIFRAVIDRLSHEIRVREDKINTFQAELNRGRPDLVSDEPSPSEFEQALRKHRQMLYGCDLDPHLINTGALVRTCHSLVKIWDQNKIERRKICRAAIEGLSMQVQLRQYKINEAQAELNREIVTGHALWWRMFLGELPFPEYDQALMNHRQSLEQFEMDPSRLTLNKLVQTCHLPNVIKEQERSEREADCKKP